MLDINGLGAKPVLKTSGSSASFKQDGVYSMVYDGQAFILQGEGGEYGTATPADVLAPKTIGTDEGVKTGTMQDLRGENLPAGWFNAERKTTVQVNQPLSGLVDAYTQYEVDMPTLLSSNIKNGVRVFGVDGDPNVVSTVDATAAAGDMLSGKNGYVKGQKVVGNIPVLTGVRNATGTAKWGDGSLAVYPERGYQQGGAGEGEIKVTVPQLQNAEPQLKAENIRAGASMFNIPGTAGSIKRVVRGSTTIEQGRDRKSVDIRSFGLNQDNTLLYFTVRTAEFYPHKYRVQGIPAGSSPLPSSPLSRIDFYLDFEGVGSIKYIEYQLVEYEGVKRRMAGYASRDTGSNPAIVNLSPAVTDMSKCILIGSYSTNQTTGGHYDPLLQFGSVSQLNLYGSTNPGFREDWFYQLIEFY